jgi:hypothetical protein
MSQCQRLHMLLLLLLLDLHMATLQVNEPLNNRTNVCSAYLPVNSRRSMPSFLSFGMACGTDGESLWMAGEQRHRQKSQTGISNTSSRSFASIAAAKLTAWLEPAVNCCTTPT